MQSRYLCGAVVALLGLLQLVMLGAALIVIP